MYKAARVAATAVGLWGGARARKLLAATMSFALSLSRPRGSRRRRPRTHRLPSTPLCGPESERGCICGAVACERSPALLWRVHGLLRSPTCSQDRYSLLPASAFPDARGARMRRRKGCCSRVNHRVDVALSLYVALSVEGERVQAAGCCCCSCRALMNMIFEFAARRM